MKAMVFHQPGPIESAPLAAVDREAPLPARGEILVRVRCCGVCHTDLHLVEGEVRGAETPRAPGHQIVGVVERTGEDVGRFREGQRVGVPWLYSTCGRCRYCHSGRENLCPEARFTGKDVDGGYAEYALARADFAVPLPEGYSDAEAAPLLCAGVVGYRALRLSGVRPGGRLGLYGFGAAAHLAIQIARYWGCEVAVFSRGASHRALARELGAGWTGRAEEPPPRPLDAAIVFAPAGGLAPRALQALAPGGVLVLAGIYMTDIPSLPYALLDGERIVRSVTNSTRWNTEEFLATAVRAGVRPRVRTFPLAEANRALLALKRSELDGAAVLEVSV